MKMSGYIKRAAALLLSAVMMAAFMPFMPAWEADITAYADDLYFTDPETGIIYAQDWSEGSLFSTYGDADCVYVAGYEGDDMYPVIPSHVTRGPRTYRVIGIGYKAFYRGNGFLTYLQSITLPSTLKYIDEQGIGGGNGITEIVIPSGVEVLGNNALSSCNQLQRILVCSNSMTAQYAAASDTSLDFIRSGVEIWGAPQPGDDPLPLMTWCADRGYEYHVFTTPTDPHWDGTVAKWDPTDLFESPDCYRLEIYKDEQYIGDELSSVNSIDLSNVMKARGRGDYTFRVSCYASHYSSFSGEYTYSGPVNTYTLEFDPGLGSGTMDPISAEAGVPVILPACTFTAPNEDMDFLCWEYLGDKCVPGQEVSLVRDDTVTALWKNKSDPGLVFSAEMPDVVLPTTAVDYNANPVETVVITNTGNQILRNIKLTLTDDTAGAFWLTTYSVPWTINTEDNCTAWYIEAKPDLAVGTYTAKLTFTADCLLEPVTANVSLTIRDHDWSEAWESDPSTHWHPCNDELCFAKKDEAPHDTNYVFGAVDPTFDTDGWTGDVYCSICDRLMEPSQVIAAGKYIRESTVTMLPARLTSNICGNDLVFTVGDSSKYTVELYQIWDHTDVVEQPMDANFIAGHEYTLHFIFVAVDPYVYKEDDSDYWSDFYVNGIETDTPLMLGGSTVRYVTFTAEDGNITPTVDLSTSLYAWDGKVKTPGVTVKDGDVTLREGIDYDVTFAGGRKNIGKYKVTVTMKGAYSGSASKEFTIGPKKAGIKNPKAGKKQFTAKWKKQSAKMVLPNGKKGRITGYQVQYSTNSDFSGAKTKTVKGYSKTSVTIKKLGSKKTYYVRVRTYVKQGGKTYYSPWSGVKKVKTK